MLIFLAFVGAIILMLLLFNGLFHWYRLRRHSWPVFKRFAQALGWVTAVHARLFEQQGPAKFRVRPTGCCTHIWQHVAPLHSAIDHPHRRAPCLLWRR